MAPRQRLRRCAIWVAAVLAASSLGLGEAAAQASSDDKFSWFEGALTPGGGFCSGHCAVHVYGGVATRTSMTSMFALDGALEPAPDEYIAPWDWDFTGTGLVAGALSRRLLTFADVIDIEGEAGIAQRFGNMHETEFWAALYARWTWFPWNHIVRTTIATSTGLSFATGASSAERAWDSRGRGSKLLHFFSPEITLGLPSQPQWDLVARIHHRSGTRILFGDVDMFKGVGGGVHFATLGLRYRF